MIKCLKCFVIVSGRFRGFKSLRIRFGGWSCCFASFKIWFFSLRCASDLRTVDRGGGTDDRGHSSRFRPALVFWTVDRGEGRSTVARSTVGVDGRPWPVQHDTDTLFHWTTFDVLSPKYPKTSLHLLGASF